MSKYNLYSRSSSIAKQYLLASISLSVFAAILIWPVNWSNVIFLIIYALSFSYLIYSFRHQQLHFQLDDKGIIEVFLPEKILGEIHVRSLYNRHLMMLCVKVNQDWKQQGSGKHVKKLRWFVVFSDSFSEREYRLLARLIRQCQG